VADFTNIAPPRAGADLPCRCVIGRAAMTSRSPGSPAGLADFL